MIVDRNKDLYAGSTGDYDKNIYMLLPIYLYGQPVLRKVATDITADYPDLKKLIEDMFETMDNAEGVGLAAPQDRFGYSGACNQSGCSFRDIS